MKPKLLMRCFGIGLSFLFLSKGYASDDQFSSPTASQLSCVDLLSSQPPERVYFNLPFNYLPLVFTLPGPFARIPDNPNSKKSELTTQFSIQCKNHGIFSVEPIRYSEILAKFAGLVPHQIWSVLSSAMEIKKIRDQTSREQLVEMLRFASVKANPSLNESIDKMAAHLLVEIENPRLEYIRNQDTRLEIEGIWLGRTYFPLEAAKNAAAAAFQETLDVLRSLSPVDRGDFLYRAPRDNEWDNILKEGSYAVLTETNFERKIGPQVSHYAKESGYAGVVIRIAVPGPFYRIAGITVPRVTSVLPHYAAVEVLDGDSWLSLEDYRRRHGL